MIRAFSGCLNAAFARFLSSALSMFPQPRTRRSAFMWIGEFTLNAVVPRQRLSDVIFDSIAASISARACSSLA